MTSTPPDKDEQTPLSEESLREKIDNILSDQHHKFHSLNDSVEAIVALILTDRQAWAECVKQSTRNIYEKELKMLRRFQELVVKKESLSLEPRIVCISCGKKIEQRNTSGRRVV